MKPIIGCLAVLAAFIVMAVAYRPILLGLVPLVIVVMVHVFGRTPRQRRRDWT